ncbi:MAG: crossover junction endodeoxyribonuclease RuvC [Bacteroidota bacterium]|nr:crossover junction endodeoxyribonuclease RuvC [Bacteroidota bacterium]
MSTKIILGIDPGTRITGYGLIMQTGKQNFELLSLGVVNLSKITDPVEKLTKLYHDICNIIATYKPDEVAIEDPFFGKNVQSMLKLGRAQGVITGAAIQHGLTIHQYSPRKIKQAITGNGNAAKSAVEAMLQTLLKFQNTEKHLDATDGLAIAMCHAMQNGNFSDHTAKRQNSWEAFLTNNPDRLK